MKRLTGVVDTIRVIQRNNLAYSYDREKDEYIVSDEAFNAVRSQAQNKAYIDRLLVGNTKRVYGGRFTLA